MKSRVLISALITFILIMLGVEQNEPRGQHDMETGSITASE